MDRGACCDFYEKIRQDFHTFLLGFDRLAGDDDLAWRMLYEKIRKMPSEMVYVTMSDNWQCPCHTAADPMAFRETFAKALSEEPMDSKALEFLKDQGKEFCNREFVPLDIATWRNRQ